MVLTNAVEQVYNTRVVRGILWISGYKRVIGVNMSTDDTTDRVAGYTGGNAESVIDANEWRGIWLGVRCDVMPTELDKFAGMLDSMAVGGEAVAGFLRSCAEVIRGTYIDATNVNRLVEIEKRAAREIEAMRTRANYGAQHMLSKLAAEMDEQSRDGFITKTMNKLGCSGFESGRLSNVSDGVRRRGGVGGAASSAVKGDRGRDAPTLRVGGRHRSYTGKSKPTGDVGVKPAVPAAVEGGKQATTSIETMKRDARYATMFESWCGVKLRSMGFKMKHCAEALGMDTSSLWRHISGYTRYWKAQALKGNAPDIPQEWHVKFEKIRDDYFVRRRRPIKPSRTATLDVGMGANVLPPV